LKWWLGAESNRRHEDFQSSALPTELPSLKLLVIRYLQQQKIEMEMFLSSNSLAVWIAPEPQYIAILHQE
jgi:hypothetical protein